MKKLLFIIILFQFISSAFSSIIINENCKIAKKKIFELNFKEAEYLISKEQHNNTYSSVLQNYIQFLKVLLNEKESDLSSYKNNVSDLINILEKEKDETPEYYSIISEIYFHSAIIKFKMGETVSGSFNFYKSYKTLLQGITKHQSNEDLLKLFAIFKIIFAAIPDEYLWLTDFIGIKGDINSGINFINLKHQKYLNENSAKSTEYQALRIIISDIFSKENNKNINITQLNIYNPLVRISYLVHLIHNGHSALALEILNRNNQKPDEYKIDYFNYLKGITKLYNIDKDANIYLEDFVTNFEGKNFIKSAYQKLSWYYLIFNNNEKFIKNSSMIKLKGITQFDADIQAINEINHYSHKNIDLLKARLLFDGGYYQKSDSILNCNLNNQNLSGFQDEILYRLARCAQKLDKTENAIGYFNKLLNQFETQSNYYCRVAYLNLGSIYEETGKMELAKDNYLLCLKSKNKQYKNSIEQKAKAGLNRIISN